MTDIKTTIFLGGLFGFAALTTVALAGNAQDAGEEISVAEAPPAWASEELSVDNEDGINSNEWRSQQQRRQRPRGARGEQGRLQRLTQALDLSEDQVDLLNEGRQTIQAEMQSLRAEMQDLRAATQSVQGQSDVDVSEIHSMIDRRSELMTEIQHLRVDAMVPFQQSLSTEQREQWQQMRRQRRARQGEGRRGRGPNRQRQRGGEQQYDSE